MPKKAQSRLNILHLKNENKSENSHKIKILNGGSIMAVMSFLSSNIVLINVLIMIAALNDR